MMKSFGKRVVELRQKKGFTRYRLAKNSGVSFAYLKALEEDNHSPSLEIVEKIASALDMTASQLIDSNPIPVESR